MAYPIFFSLKTTNLVKDLKKFVNLSFEEITEKACQEIDEFSPILKEEFSERPVCFVLGEGWLEKVITSEQVAFLKEKLCTVSKAHQVAIVTGTVLIKHPLMCIEQLDDIDKAYERTVIQEVREMEYRDALKKEVRGYQDLPGTFYTHETHTSNPNEEYKGNHCFIGREQFHVKTLKKNPDKWRGKNNAFILENTGWFIQNGEILGEFVKQLPSCEEVPYPLRPLGTDYNIGEQKEMYVFSPGVNQRSRVFRLDETTEIVPLVCRELTIPSIIQEVKPHQIVLGICDNLNLEHFLFNGNPTVVVDKRRKTLLIRKKNTESLDIFSSNMNKPRTGKTSLAKFRIRENEVEEDGLTAIYFPPMRKPSKARQFERNAIPQKRLKKNKNSNVQTESKLPKVENPHFLDERKEFKEKKLPLSQVKEKKDNSSPSNKFELSHIPATIKLKGSCSETKTVISSEKKLPEKRKKDLVSLDSILISMGASHLEPRRKILKVAECPQVAINDIPVRTHVYPFNTSFEDIKRVKNNLNQLIKEYSIGTLVREIHNATVTLQGQPRQDQLTVIISDLKKLESCLRSETYDPESIDKNLENIVHQLEIILDAPFPPSALLYMKMSREILFASVLKSRMENKDENAPKTNLNLTHSSLSSFGQSSLFSSNQSCSSRSLPSLPFLLPRKTFS